MREFVCKDVNGPSIWEYDPDDKTYHRQFENGDIRYIKGEFLPDPFILWENRQKIAKKANPSLSIENLKNATRPQEATFALWNHYQEVCH